MFLGLVWGRQVRHECSSRRDLKVVTLERLETFVETFAETFDERSRADLAGARRPGAEDGASRFRLAAGA